VPGWIGPQGNGQKKKHCGAEAQGLNLKQAKEAQDLMAALRLGGTAKDKGQKTRLYEFFRCRGRILFRFEKKSSEGTARRLEEPKRK